MMLAKLHEELKKSRFFKKNSQWWKNFRNEIRNIHFVEHGPRTHRHKNDSSPYSFGDMNQNINFIIIAPPCVGLMCVCALE